MSRKLAPYCLILTIILSRAISYLLGKGGFDINSLPDEPVKNFQDGNFSNPGFTFISNTVGTSSVSPSHSVGSTTT